MSDATDVLQAVDQLRRDLSGYHGQLKAHNDLQRHCDHQRERIVELEAIHARDKAENTNLRELATYALKHIIEAECEDPDRDRKRFWGKPCEDCSDCGSSDCPKCMPRMFGVSGIEVD
jgi:hypothetical protein